MNNGIALIIVVYGVSFLLSMNYMRSQEGDSSTWDSADWLIIALITGVFFISWILFIVNDVIPFLFKSRKVIKIGGVK